MLPLNIGGTIDRMDSKGDTLRIVDYKTGWHSQDSRKHRAVVYPADNRPNYIFQTFLYAAIMSRKARTESSSIPAVHPPCGIRKLARYRNGHRASPKYRSTILRF